MRKSTQLKLIFIFGVTFVTVILVIALVVKNPTPLLLWTCSIIMALAAGGIAALIPGALEIELPIGVKAVGALAVFYLVLQKDPAKFAVQPVKTVATVGVRKKLTPALGITTELATPTEADKQKAAVDALRQKNPPYGYRFSPSSPEIWTHYQGRRIWVKDAKSIDGGLDCPIEPLGVFVPEDSQHYYDAGDIKAR